MSNLAALLGKASQPAATPNVRRIVSTSLRAGEANAIEAESASYELARAGHIVKRQNQLVRADVIPQDMHDFVDPDFPFDDSQLEFINGLSTHQYACGTGAAGTGKTTCTKAVVARLLSQGAVGFVDLATYWKAGVDGDGDDEYQVPTESTRVASICNVAFTGQATQMIRKNFPVSWHPNVMTIHRMLGFYPEFYEDTDENGNAKKKRRFVPGYTKENPLPWNTIIIDEGGMLGLDLWHQLWDACKPNTKIIIIGDLNQLQPVHGKSIFGYAMSQWPTYELTKPHRATNRIVDVAWNILEGRIPTSDIPNLKLESNEDILNTLQQMVKNPDWQFLRVQIPFDTMLAARNIQIVLTQLAKKTKIYDPLVDALITPINGFDGAAGQDLGQIPMNRELVLRINGDSARMVIDAGAETKLFAVGDKVMATKNDHEIGVTNGMVGIIERIDDHPAYLGDRNQVGNFADVQRYRMELARTGGIKDHESLEEVMAKAFGIEDVAESEVGEADDGRYRGPASHVITVRFPHREASFSTYSEVCSLSHAYAMTCHKMQGGEAPLVMSVLHHSHGGMLNREWAYTALTRSKSRHIMFCTVQGVKSALIKQGIKGRTLQEKVASFTKLYKLKAGKVRLPASPEVILNQPTDVVVPDRMAERLKAAQLDEAARIRAQRAEAEAFAEWLIAAARASKWAPIHEMWEVAKPVDGGDLTPRRPRVLRLGTTYVEPLRLMAPPKALPAPPTPPKPTGRPTLAGLLMKKG